MYLSLSLSLYIYIYIHTNTCVYIYIYIYIYMFIHIQYNYNIHIHIYYALYLSIYPSWQFLTWRYRVIAWPCPPVAGRGVSQHCIFQVLQRRAAGGESLSEVAVAAYLVCSSLLLKSVFFCGIRCFLRVEVCLFVSAYFECVSFG